MLKCLLVVSAGTTAVPIPLAVGAVTVFPSVIQEESTLRNAGGMVGLVDAGSDLPIELLHSE